MDDLFKTDPIKDSFKFHKKRLPQHVLGHMSMLQYILYMEHHLTTTINPLYNSLLKTIRSILMILPARIDGMKFPSRQCTSGVKISARDETYPGLKFLSYKQNIQNNSFP